LEFERLKWDRTAAGIVEPESVRYACAHCPHEVPARDKPAMIRAGRWRSTAVAKVPHKRSFWLHGLCAAFALWEEVAQEFVTANSQADPAKRADQLRAFFNTTLGTLYKDKAAESTAAALLARAHRYDGGSGDEPVRFQVPREAAILTAGFDVQDDRIEGVVRAWGAGEQSWLIERVILRGDTSQSDIWQALDQFRTERTWLHEDGARLKIRSLTVDSGDGEHTKRVYHWCAPRLYQGVYATKGHNLITAPMIPTKPTKVKPGRLYMLGVHSIMTRLYRRLSSVQPGPGYYHLNEYATEDYVTQLLSMRQKFDEKQKKKKWEATPGVRNEVADAETYAYAALLLGPVPVASLGAEAIKVQDEGVRLAKRVETVDKPIPAPVAPKTTKAWLPQRGGWL
jgi:phage terminase large subunit GpA-like protein